MLVVKISRFQLKNTHHIADLQCQINTAEKIATSYGRKIALVDEKIGKHIIQKQQDLEDEILKVSKRTDGLEGVIKALDNKICICALLSMAI